MNTTNKTAVIEWLSENGIDIDIDFPYYLNDADFDSADDIQSILEDNGCFEVEVIYHYNAMKILSEHDASLRRSMELASELGYEAININSELLASLLASDMLSDEWNNIYSDLEDFIIELSEIEEA
jgi:sugar phosphate isomerase/epimerase